MTKPTDQQKQELIDALKQGPRRYEIHLTGYGGEIVLGTIKQDQFEFWNKRQDLDEHVYDWDEEPDIPQDMQLFPAGEWWDLDDLAHHNGVEFSSSCWISVYDEQGQEIWTSPLDVDSLEQKGLDTQGMHRGEFYVSSHSPDTKYVFLGQSIEKGTFWTGEIETHGDFDPSKLSFSTIDVEGWELVDGVSYESLELDDTGGYSTTGKSSDYKVFQVENQ